MTILHQIALHLKYAYEAIWHFEGQGRSRSMTSTGQDSNEDDDDDEPILYSLSEARTLVEISGKFLKACIESDTEVLTFIVLECPSATVSRYLSLKTKK